MNRGLLGTALLSGLLFVVALTTRRELPPAEPPPRPQRIVPFTFAACEVLLEVVDRDRIAGMPAEVASSPYSCIRDRVSGIPLLPSDPEALVALKPDLVVTASYVSRQMTRQLDLSRIPHRTLTDFNDVPSILGNIETLGAWVGEHERARALADRCRADIASLRAGIPAGPPPRVMTLGHDGTTAGRRTTFHSLIELAGARNVSAERGIDGFLPVSPEQVIEWDPDVIVVGIDPISGVSPRARIMADAAYAPLRSKRIVEIPLAYFTSVSHHVVDALRLLAEGLHR